MAYGASVEADPASAKKLPFQFTPLSSLSEEDDQLTRVLAQWDRLVMQVTELLASDDKNKDLICADLDAFGIQLKAVEARIGMDPSSDPSSNVWGGICELREETKDQGEIINQLVDEVEATNADVATEKDRSAKRDGIIQDLRQAHEELAELTGFLNAEQESVMKEMETLKSRATGFAGAAARAPMESTVG